MGDSPSAREEVVRVVGGVMPPLMETGTSEKVLFRTGRGMVDGENRLEDLWEE